MSDLISRKALCEYALNTIDKTVSPNDIMRFPSAEPERTAKVRDKKDESMIDYGYHGRCMNCGKQVRRRDNYCSRCGCRLEWE